MTKHNKHQYKSLVGDKTIAIQWLQVEDDPTRHRVETFEASYITYDKNLGNNFLHAYNNKREVMIPLEHVVAAQLSDNLEYILRMILEAWSLEDSNIEPPVNFNDIAPHTIIALAAQFFQIESVFKGIVSKYGSNPIY